MKRNQLRQQIAAAQDRKLEKVTAGTIPGWDFDVWLRQLSGKDGNDLSAVFTDTKTKSGEGAANVAFCDLLVVRSLTDEDGERLFEDNEIELVTSRGQDAVKVLTKRCMELNKLDKTSQDAQVKPSDSGPIS
jgi:hypothetical protein